MWIAYVFATTLILIIPGPTIILVISQSVTHGRKSVVPLATGVVCGDFTAMTLSLLGLGAIMSASAALFTLFKWMGALYLLFLGIRLWRAKPYSISIQRGNQYGTPRSLFKSAFIVTALNPKGIALVNKARCLTGLFSYSWGGRACFPIGKKRCRLPLRNCR